MTPAWSAADLRDFFNERAAIIEFDAGLDRLEAEAAAMAEVIEMIAGTDAPVANALANRKRKPGVYRVVSQFEIRMSDAH